eukprot:767087-Hanusia_phi.AAC.2
MPHPSALRRPGPASLRGHSEAYAAQCRWTRINMLHTIYELASIMLRTSCVTGTGQAGLSCSGRRDRDADSDVDRETDMKNSDVDRETDMKNSD